MDTISIHFEHGLGDASNFAHLLPLYTRRGYDVEVYCTPDKAVLFKAAGIRVVPQAADRMNWWHPPAPGSPKHDDPWSGNKCAWGISQPPLPNIGSYEEHWQEYIDIKLDLEQFTTQEIKNDVLGFISSLPRPLILFAPQGNTGQSEKNLSNEQQSEILLGLLNSTRGSIVLLDWDQRVVQLSNGRVRHLTGDWKGIDLLHLYCLMQAADLLIAVDSGPLHFARFTQIPTLGVWTRHHPSSFTLPRTRTLNLAPARQSNWTRYRRWAYQIATYPDDQLGRCIVQAAERILGEPRYLDNACADALLLSLLDNLSQKTNGSPLTTWYDRHISFSTFLDYAKRREAPTIVETGCMRAEEDWTAGMSTYLIGYFLQQHGGHLHSIDLDSRHVEFARSWTRGMPVTLHHANSHTWLKQSTGTIDLAYLDSADTGTIGYQECCLEEARLTTPRIALEGAILIDDTCWQSGKITGKGALAVPWLISQGFKVIYHGYQCLLTRENQ